MWRQRAFCTHCTLQAGTARSDELHTNVSSCFLCLRHGEPLRQHHSSTCLFSMGCHTLPCNSVQHAWMHCWLHLQAGDAAARHRLATSNLHAAKAKLEALLQGAAAKQLIQLASNPNPLPHGTEVGLAA